MQGELSRDIMQYVNHSTREGAGPQNLWVLYNHTEIKTTQQNTAGKLSMEIRQTSRHKPAREKAQGFPLHLAAVHVLFLHHLFAAFLLLP